MKLLPKDINTDAWQTVVPVVLFVAGMDALGLLCFVGSFHLWLDKIFGKILRLPKTSLDAKKL